MTWFLAWERILCCPVSPQVLKWWLTSHQCLIDLWGIRGEARKGQKPSLNKLDPDSSSPLSHGLTLSALTYVLDSSKLRPNLTPVVSVPMSLEVSHLMCVSWFSPLKQCSSIGGQLRKLKVIAFGAWGKISVQHKQFFFPLWKKLIIHFLKFSLS